MMAQFSASKFFNLSKVILMLLLVLFSQTTRANNLLLIAGWEKPPYIEPNNNSGFEIELMQQLLTQMGHTVSFLYVPYGRTYETMKRENADIGLTLNAKSGVPSEYLSQTYVTYQNVAVSLKKAKFTINQLSDLSKRSVIAFQSASKVLGQQFNAAVTHNLFYIELPNQRRQAEMLLLGSVDVVVMDVNIFNFFSQQIKGKNQMAEVNVYPLFPPTQYSAAIHNAQLREAFNLALPEFQATQQYQALIDKYDLYKLTF